MQRKKVSLDNSSCFKLLPPDLALNDTIYPAITVAPVLVLIRVVKKSGKQRICNEQQILEEHFWLNKCHRQQLHEGNEKHRSLIRLPEERKGCSIKQGN